MSLNWEEWGLNDLIWCCLLLGDSTGLNHSDHIPHHFTVIRVWVWGESCIASAWDDFKSTSNWNDSWIRNDPQMAGMAFKWKEWPCEEYNNEMEWQNDSGMRRFSELRVWPCFINLPSFLLIPSFLEWQDWSEWSVNDWNDSWMKSPPL